VISRLWWLVAVALCVAASAVGLCGPTTRVSVDSTGGQADGASWWPPAVSSDGRIIAFSSDAGNLVTGDNNSKSDIFVHDRQTGATTRISVDSAGTQATGGDSRTPILSMDGRHVVFHSLATNLVAGDTNALADIFVRNVLFP